MIKAELIERMEAGRAEWERLLVEVGEPRMNEPGVAGDWSVKDIVAHVMAYERWTAGQIAAGVRGDEPTPRELFDLDETPAGADTFDMDARNAALREHYRDAPLAETLASARRAFEQLIEVAQSLPEDALADPGRYAWTGGMSLLELIPQQSYEHYDQHTPSIRAWLDRS